MSVENVLTAGVYQQYLSQYKKPRFDRYQRLSDDEAVVIYAYTTDDDINSYKDLNYQLRERSIEADKFILVEAIVNGISSIEKDISSSQYFRFTALSFDDIKKIYSVGHIATHTFFTSVSEEARNFIGGDCNVFISINPDSKKITPAYIGDISNFPEEKEYLFPPNTYFHVLQVLEADDGNFDILLQERPLCQK